jgi:hypothetical protein
VSTNGIAHIKFREYWLSVPKVEMGYAKNNTRMDTEKTVIS